MEKSINLRLWEASGAAYLELESRSNAGRGITTHSELYRLTLVLRATTRDIEWSEVPNPLPSNPFDIDIDATLELTKQIRSHAALDYFQKSPTNILLAESLEHLAQELKRYAVEAEPRARSGGLEEGDPACHPLELEWQESSEAQRKRES